MQSYLMQPLERYIVSILQLKCNFECNNKNFSWLCFLFYEPIADNSSPSASL